MSLVERALRLAADARQKERVRAADVGKELSALREREPEFAAWVDEFKGFFGGRVAIIEDKVTGRVYGRRPYEREYIAHSGARSRVKRG